MMSDTKTKYFLLIIFLMVLPLFAIFVVLVSAISIKNSSKSPIVVQPPVLIPADVFSKDPEMYTVSVLDLSYIPVADNKVDISITGDWQNRNIVDLADNIDDLRKDLVEALSKGSTYHGYKDSLSTPSLKYEILDKKIFYNPVPKSTRFLGMDGAPSPDHLKILEDLDICDYVENKGVGEVWIWMYHTKETAPIESNMAGPYGDISNSYREDDLPQCKNTYTVYDYNYGRSVAMALEDHTHQLEAILREVDSDLFWDEFVGLNSVGGRCGWTHYPPNAVRDYDWENERTVYSDCESWDPQGGTKEPIDCHTWSKSNYDCAADEGLSFKIWWMQNIPGKDNGLSYNGKKLKNWWSFIGDFDNVMKEKSLY